jgi:hypothetical protein
MAQVAEHSPNKHKVQVQTQHQNNNNNNKKKQLNKKNPLVFQTSKKTEPIGEN